jgi:hypothetical protein
MRQEFGLGLVALGILLAVASVLAYTAGAEALRQDAPYFGVVAVLALASGATLWVIDRRQARPGQLSSGENGRIAAMTRTVGGRTHVRGIPYVLPRDLEEMNRLDFQHYVLRQAF